MIKRVCLTEELSRLPFCGVEAQKIRALLLAYGIGYDFCRFFVSNGLILCDLSGSFVVCELDGFFDHFDNNDISELTDFFAFNGFNEIFCSEKVGRMLSTYLNCGSQRVNLMRFFGTPVKCGEMETDPSLDDVYKIISSSFAIDRERWYVDMSHRIRHGVAKARLLGGSALIIQHDLNGEALLSQVATLPEHRRQGNAARLISSVCAELSQSKIYVLCENSLVSFYQKIGFEQTDKKYVFSRDIRDKIV